MALQAAALYATVSVAGASRAVGELGAVSKAADATQGHLTLLGRKSQGIGKGIGQLGTGIWNVAKTAAAATLALGVGATVVAASMEDAFAGVKKTVEGGTEELDHLYESLKTLSTRIPVSFQDLAGIATEAGALNVATSDVDKFTEAVARTTAATVGLETQMASEAFGKIGTIFQLHGTDYERLGSVLVELGRNAASTESDIIDVSERFAAAGRSAGLSTAQVLGWSSAIASLGPEAEAAGSSLSRVFNKLTQNIALQDEPGKLGENARNRLAQFAKVSAMSVKEFTKLYAVDASGAMDIFLEKLGKLDKFEAARALRKAGIINVRDINAILLLAQHTDVLDKNLTMANKAWTENTALVEVSTKRFDTLKNHMIELWNTVKVGAAAFGEGFLPALSKVAKKAKDLILAHMSDFKRMGVEVGEAIDGINWDRVESGLKTMASIAATVLGTVKSIAGIFPEMTIALAGLFGLNKLSGGFFAKGVGNIVGGVFNQFFARGASPANPMWVASVGGLGGTVPVGAAGGKLGGLLRATIVGAVVVEGLALWADSMMGFVEKNQALKDQGATPGQIADTKFNALDYAGQQQAIKHGYKPSGEPPFVAGLTNGAQDLQEAASQLRNAAHDMSGAATTTSDAAKMSAAEAHAQYKASRAIFGDLRENAPTATNINRPLGFLQAPSRHKGSDIVTVAAALTTHFLRTKAPVYQSDKNLARTLEALRHDQHVLTTRGDTKNAAAIGKEIHRLEQEQARRTAAASAKATAVADAAKRAVVSAIMRQDLEANVNVQVHPGTTVININGKAIASSITGYTAPGWVRGA